MTESRFLHVTGCPLCEYFTTTKLDDVRVYHISKSFIVIECPKCNRPLVISRNHISRSADLGTEDWGWILKVCRKLFGNSMKLITSKNGEGKRLRDIFPCRLPEDHWCAHIDISMKEY